MDNAGIYSNCTNCSENTLGASEPNHWCLLLVILPICCIFGNCLVVTAVLSDKTLKTSTNFLLVSLAAADLLIGSLVMPFAIYLTVNNLKWYLPHVLCNFFCVVDVSASTASIVHLVAISMDRFFAVVKQFEYKTAKHQRRIYATIIFAWVFSLSIGLPLGTIHSLRIDTFSPSEDLTWIGLNQGQQGTDGEYECGIVNPMFMFVCSIGKLYPYVTLSFYIPCVLMIIMYSFVFYQLRCRLRAVKLQEMAAGNMVDWGANIGNILQNAYGPPGEMKNNTMMWALPFLQNIEQTLEQDDRDAHSFIILHHHLKKNEERLAVTFLLCWIPFFTMNIIKVIKIWNGTWTDSLERIFIFFTWLGYLNSCLNPLTYSAINRKFRAAFRTILHCPGPPKKHHKGTSSHVMRD